MDAVLKVTTNAMEVERGESAVLHDERENFDFNDFAFWRIDVSNFTSNEIVIALNNYNEILQISA